MPHPNHQSPEQIAAQISAQHTEGGMTWRAISEAIYTRTGIHIPHATIAYFVKQGGRYIPGNTLYCVALGLRKARQPRRISEMSRAALVWALEHRQEM